MSKTLGQCAYEASVRANPTYANGNPRPAWGDLLPTAQRVWATLDRDLVTCPTCLIDRPKGREFCCNDDACPELVTP